MAETLKEFEKAYAEFQTWLLSASVDELRAVYAQGPHVRFYDAIHNHLQLLELRKAPIESITITVKLSDGSIEEQSVDSAEFFMVDLCTAAGNGKSVIEAMEFLMDRGSRHLPDTSNALWNDKIGLSSKSD